MIVAKFGGTCVTAQNLKKIKKIVNENYKAVVVSAIGKSFDSDEKVTDLLLKLHQSLPDISIFNLVAKSYRNLVKAYAIKLDIERLLADTISDIVKKNSLDNTVSKGEELAAKIVASYLGFDYIEVESLIVFRHGKLLLKQTIENLAYAFRGVKQCVLGGFYGSELGVRKVFSRGGSDITGALVANAADASVYENWTDVDGFFVANPRLASNARLVKCISYDEMKLLSSCGGRVLHPDSVLPTQLKGIPIHIRNIYNPDSVGTLVNIQSSKGQVLGIFEQKNSKNEFETKVVFSSELQDVLKWSCEVMTENNCLKSICGEENMLTFLSTKSKLKELVKSLKD